LFALELLLNRLNTPDKLLDNISQRQRLHGFVYAHDELNFAGYYIKFGNLDFSKQMSQKGMIVVGDDFSRIFDEDWYESHSIKVKRQENEGDPFFSLMERKGDQIVFNPLSSSLTSQTQPRGRPAPTQEPEQGMKGRNRNPPCPCGSGRKYKQCCGR
jgi:hypothetical protein